MATPEIETCRGRTLARYFAQIDEHRSDDFRIFTARVDSTHLQKSRSCEVR